MRSTARVAIWLAYWAIMFCATHLRPPGRLEVPEGHVDKVLHLVMFAVLAGWGGWTLRLQSLRGSILLALCLVAYAAIDEWTQGWTGRTPDEADWLADVAGVVVGMLICRWRRPRGTGRAESLASGS